MTDLRLGAQSALAASVLLGVCGMTDQHPAKLYLVLVAGVLGWAYFRNKK